MQECCRLVTFRSSNNTFVFVCSGIKCKQWQEYELMITVRTFWLKNRLSPSPHNDNSTSCMTVFFRCEIFYFLSGSFFYIPRSDANHCDVPLTAAALFCHHFLLNIFSFVVFMLCVILITCLVWVSMSRFLCNDNNSVIVLWLEVSWSSLVTFVTGTRCVSWKLQCVSAAVVAVELLALMLTFLVALFCVHCMCYTWVMCIDLTM